MTNDRADDWIGEYEARTGVVVSDEMKARLREKYDEWVHKMLYGDSKPGDPVPRGIVNASREEAELRANLDLVLTPRSISIPVSEGLARLYPNGLPPYPFGAPQS